MTLKTPGKLELVLASVLITTWFVVASYIADFNLIKAGYWTIGMAVGVIFAMFGVAAHKSWKNMLAIVVVSFLSSMTFDFVSRFIISLN